MRLSKFMVGLAAASLIGLGSAAQANAANPLSVVRHGAALGSDAQQLDGLRGETVWILGALVLALGIWAGIEIIGDGVHDLPISV